MKQREDGRWVLIGTVSHGIKCAEPVSPDEYLIILRFFHMLISFALTLNRIYLASICVPRPIGYGLRR